MCCFFVVCVSRGDFGKSIQFTCTTSATGAIDGGRVGGECMCTHALHSPHLTQFDLIVAIRDVSRLQATTSTDSCSTSIYIYIKNGQSHFLIARGAFHVSRTLHSKRHLTIFTQPYTHTNKRAPTFHSVVWFSSVYIYIYTLFPTNH